jgi:hypothetical protein
LPKCARLRPSKGLRFFIKDPPRLGRIAAVSGSSQLVSLNLVQYYRARILGASQTCSHSGGVNKTIYTRQAECLREVLVQIRQKAGLTQRQLAAKLRRERNLIGRLEVGQRRLDVVEFYSICKACAADPRKIMEDLLSKFDEIQAAAKG